MQERYNRTQFTILARRRQLFADWYKYMLSAYPAGDLETAYPPPDEIMGFLRQEMADMTRLIAETDVLLMPTSMQGTDWQAGSQQQNPATLAGKLAMAINEINWQLGLLNQDPESLAAGVVFSLHGIESPRYWQPNDPSVLISGAIAEPTDRHDTGLVQGNILIASTSLLDNASGGWNVGADYLDFVTGSEPATGQSQFGYEQWAGQPWNPILVEWEVSMLPLTTGPDYPQDFVCSRYTLPLNAADLRLEPGQDVPLTANTYRGRTLLTPYSGILIQERIVAALNANIMPAWYLANPGTPPSDTFLLDADNLAQVQSWYVDTYLTNKNSEQQAADANYTLLQALTRLQTTHYLSQSLDGFNAGLIQHKNTLQLPVLEPIGFAANQAFTAEVADLVATQQRSAPLPANHFNPIRAGKGRLARLQIVDSFGQMVELSTQDMIRSEPLEDTDTDAFQLVPRLAQPARIQFRWLSADNGDVEMNAHPVTNPVCGWILPNNLDSSLFFYNTAGEALGYIDQNCRWEAAPGSAAAVSDPNLLPDPHLQKVVGYLLRQGSEYFQNFILTLDNGIVNSNPENYAFTGNLAFLMARPLAIARAMVQFQVQGEPAINESWEQFKLDLGRSYRDRGGFQDIKFPVRLGEYAQMNDGLIGFWKESGDEFVDDNFYAPQSTSAQMAHIVTLESPQSDFELFLSLDDDPALLTLLLDPRGKVHITTGILPVKAIDIPADQYAKALNNMEISFLSTPVLTDKENLGLPTPDLPGFTWSWVERDAWTWREDDDISPMSLQARFSGTQEIVEGWLKLKPDPTGTSSNTASSDSEPED